MMRKGYLLALLMFISLPEISGALTAEEVVKKSAALLSSSKGVSADFLFTVSGNKTRGNIKADRQKFMIDTSGFKIWYNGKEMSTYNQRTSETIITTPDKEELAQTNPFEYLKINLDSYSISFVPASSTSQYSVRLQAKSSKMEFKNMTFTIRKSDSVPESIVVQPRTGQPIHITITNFKKDLNLPASTFEYPKSQYPGIEVVDLR